ncbi:MAG TPA: response regulator [Nevskiaceae bacterium]|nr:response regulator [Nevskiaceae bacterium]
MNILIVDDEPALVAQLEKLTTRLGHNVNTAFNGRQAMESVAAHRDEYHLVISDIRMPEMDGLGLSRTIHKYDVNVPVAFMTGHGDANLAAEAIRTNAIDFVTKPFGIKELRTLLDKISAVYSDSEHQHLWEVDGAHLNCVAVGGPGAIPTIVTELEARVKPYLTAGGIPSRAYALTVAEALRNAMQYGVTDDMGMVMLRVDCNRDVIVTTIVDEGDGFAYESAGLSPTGDDPDKPQRGLFIIRNWMDDVTFGGGGNTIRMVRKLKSPVENVTLAA